MAFLAFGYRLNSKLIPPDYPFGTPMARGRRRARPLADAARHWLRPLALGAGLLAVSPLAPATAAERECAALGTAGASRGDEQRATKDAATDRTAGADAGSPRVLGLDDDGSLRLADGRRFVPGQVAIPVRLGADAPLWARARAAVATSLAGQPVRLGPTATDRHGRLTGPAELLNDSGMGRDLALALVRTGAAFADPAAPCAKTFLEAEDQARRARRGLWGSAGALHATTDIAGLSARAGLFSVAEGRILTVGVRRDRTYLNFGDSWRQDFTVMMATADFATILGHGLDAAMLRGTMVRVRGVVREQGGPAMVVHAAAAVTQLAEQDLERSQDHEGTAE